MKFFVNLFRDMQCKIFKYLENLLKKFRHQLKMFSCRKLERLEVEQFLCKTKS